MSEKNADELFAVDTTGSKEISKKYNLKPLKADEILAQRSAVPAVDGRKRAGQDLASGIYEPVSKKRKGDWVAKKDVQRLKKTINAVSHLQNSATDEPANPFDLWDAPPVQKPEDSLEYIPKTKPKVAPPTIERVPIALTATGKHVKSVPQPKAGSSYNPDYEEWNDAIIKEGDKELAAEQVRLKAEQVEAEKQARIDAAKDDELAYRTEDESAWEGFETENEDVEALKKKRARRLTPAERNKVKRRKDAERQAKHEKKMADKKKIAQELGRMISEHPLATASVKDAVAQVQAALDTEDSDSEDDSKLRRKKFGNVVVPQKNLEIVLPDELQDSLRRLKPEGNLLQDRFRNLLVNGKLEARKPVLQPKRKRMKLTEKWAFKDFGVQV